MRFILNLKTAKAFSLELSPTLLALAERCMNDLSLNDRLAARLTGLFRASGLNRSRGRRRGTWPD